MRLFLFLKESQLMRNTVGSHLFRQTEVKQSPSESFRLVPTSGEILEESCVRDFREFRQKSNGSDQIRQILRCSRKNLPGAFFRLHAQMKVGLEWILYKSFRYRYIPYEWVVEAEINVRLMIQKSCLIKWTTKVQDTFCILWLSPSVK